MRRALSLGCAVAATAAAPRVAAAMAPRALAATAPRVAVAAAAPAARAFHSARPALFKLGDVAPDFTADSTQGKIEFHKWIGNSWALLVSHPKDFTPVCTTELSELGKIAPQLRARNIKAIGLSCEDVKKHKKWEKDVLEYGNLTGDSLPYPILADRDRKIATTYEMFDPNIKDEDDGLPVTVRTVFLVDNNKKFRFIAQYPSSTGRSWPEILRVIDSIILADKHPVATPHGWKPGDDVVVSPAIKTEDAKKMFPQIRVIKPYLRIIPQPK